MKVEEEVPRWTLHQTSASNFSERYMEFSPNFGVEVWWMVPKWESRQTWTPKFGECIQHGDVTKTLVPKLGDGCNLEGKMFNAQESLVQNFWNVDCVDQNLAPNFEWPTTSKKEF